MRKNTKGFTLIELIITVAIIGILASIALPSYNQYIRRGKRTDAKTALMGLLQAQEKFRANCDQYGASLGASDSCSASSYILAYPSTTANSLYTIGVTNSDGVSFTATATAVAGTSQAADTGCTTMTLAQSKGTVTTTPSTCW